MTNTEKYGELIFQDNTTQIFYNYDRELITTLESRKSTHPQAVGREVHGTSFGSTDQIKFYDRKDLEIEVWFALHFSIIRAMIRKLGIKDFEIEPFTINRDLKFYHCHIIKFSNNSDYAFFKLKYFHNFVLDPVK